MNSTIVLNTLSGKVVHLASTTGHAPLETQGWGIQADVGTLKQASRFGGNKERPPGVP